MLEDYIKNLEKEFTQHGYDFPASISDAQKLCLLYAYYHYFSADDSMIDESINGLIRQEKGQSLISGIYIDSDADVETIDVLVVSLTDGGPLDIPPSLSLFRKVQTEISEALHGRGNVQVVSFFADEDHKPSKIKPLSIKLLTDVTSRSSSFKKSLRNALAITKPDNNYTSFAFVLAPEIENDILEIEDPKEYVSSGSVVIDSGNNVLHFGKEESLIVNVAASSIKDLFIQYSYRGLFAQNLRYYIANPKIDNNIVDSITSRPDNFWYYNNGIIIICDDYQILENSIELTNFSIINGGQTTFLIGDTDFSHDFFVQCKIIKNKYVDPDDRIDFISTVAEATNTQKPIKSKDLVANQKEQRLLKKQLADEHIFCSIKRGQKVNKRLYPEAWQNTSNEEIAQFMYSFMYQKPGSAKGGKSSLCSNPDKYSLIFGKSYSSELIKDLLIIKQSFKKWGHQKTKTITKEDGQNGSYQISVAKYGMFFTVAILGILIKTYYYPYYVDAYKHANSSDEKMEVLSQYDINHHLLAENFSIDDLYQLFDYCSDAIIDGFNLLQSFKPSYTSIANFVKPDSMYCTYIVNNMMYRLQSPLPGNLEEIRQRTVHQQTENEKDLDKEIKENYSNSLSTEMANKTRLPQEVYDDIREELTKYRTTTFKANHIKAYVVFKNNARDKISSYGAETLDDLKDLRCLDRPQIKKYGKDILKIIKTVMVKHGY